ncbi:pentapeptide repeat-containing protein [Streptomyces sp. NPDC005531]|uniref:pentapeptide repeat-containing protein n=1 Tax=Streptomyces sp. NPDC005531 TaxID=3364722 RepID=UPI0036AAE909
MASSAQRRVQPISWWWALLAALVVAVVIVVTMWAMLAQADKLLGAARATARIDAIKAALTVGAGTGGVAALLLALRRQWLSEHTHVRQEKADATAEFDAAERRITELYTAAAGQLGNDSASVRLAGLYALERLAQDHPGHRQTVVNVLCAYLRMPLMPALLALDPGAPDRDGHIAERRNAKAKQGQELLVREAVHGILRQHLSVSPIEGGASPHPMEDHWPDIDIDLRGADLRDFDFATCRVRVANFMKATFRNGSNFACAEFTEHAYFHNATFLGGVTFRGTWFGLRTVFAETTFEGTDRLPVSHLRWHRILLERHIRRQVHVQERPRQCGVQHELGHAACVARGLDGAASARGRAPPGRPEARGTADAVARATPLRHSMASRSQGPTPLIGQSGAVFTPITKPWPVV